MRRAALLTVLFFLGQAGLCAHGGFGAAAVFGPGASVAAGASAQAEAGMPGPHTTESPARRCQRHCAQVARCVPAAAFPPQPAAPLRLPLEPVSFEPAERIQAAPLAPERAPPPAALRLLLASLQV